MEVHHHDYSFDWDYTAYPTGYNRQKDYTKAELAAFKEENQRKGICDMSNEKRAKARRKRQKSKKAKKH